MDTLTTLLTQRPMFHKGETEIQRNFIAEESLLPPKEKQRIADTALTCYGIESAVLSFIAGNVHPGDKTLETGAGCSTLVFAYCGASHIAVTPSASEIELIKEYAAANQIAMSATTFIQESSDQYLPGCDVADLDVVLLDGKHAFPWPVIDWFYTADKLKQNGLMIIDDAEMKSVSILIDFMKVDSGWELVENFGGKTIVFKKIRLLAHDVAWHMQPYIVADKSPLEKLARKLQRVVTG